MDKSSFEQQWMQKAKWLTQALIISATLNIGFFATFVYFVLKEKQMSISFEHKNKDFAFKEEVKAFTLADFERLLSKSGFQLVEHFGDYGLNPFNQVQSDRLILICKKAND